MEKEEPLQLRINRFKHYIIDQNQVLDKGKFGAVYGGINTKTNQKVAIKIIDLARCDRLIKQTFQKVEAMQQQQIKILQQIKHQNIVRIYENGIQNQCYCKVFEKCEFNLAELITAKKKSAKKIFSQEQCLFLIFQLFDAFKILNKKKIVRKNLNPQNIFIKDGVLKVGGFELLNSFGNQNTGEKTNIKMEYMPLEVLKNQLFSQKTDVWALGCIFYMLLHGEIPWIQKNQEKTMKYLQCLSEKLNLINVRKHRKDLSKQTIQILQHCLQILEIDRFSWKQIFSKHGDFFQKQKDINKRSDQFKKNIKQLVEKQAKNNNFQKLSKNILINQFSVPDRYQKLEQRCNILTQKEEKNIGKSGNDSSIKTVFDQQKYQLKQKALKKYLLNSVFKNKKNLLQQGYCMNKNFQANGIPCGINYWKQFGIELQQQKYYLTIYNKKLNVKKLIQKISDNYLEFLRLTCCSIGDTGFQEIINNCHLFFGLKILMISQNQITTVTRKDLQKLPSLKFISLANNPLSENTIKQLRQFKNENPKFKLDVTINNQYAIL